MAILQIVGTGAGDLLRSTNGGPTEIFGDVSPTSATAATAPFGNDTLFGGPGADTLFGQQGTDSIVGSGNDDLRGGQGADTLVGTGSDSLFGNKDADQLFGGLSAFGGQGNDTIFGSTTGRGELGNDIIYGGTTLIGGNGNDTLVGSSASQTFTGNETTEDEFNADQFVFAPATPLTISGQSIVQGGFGGNDTITDFQSGPGLGDVIKLLNLDAGATVAVSQTGADVTITVAGTTSPDAGSPVPASTSGSVTTGSNQSAAQTIIVRNVNIQQFLAVGSEDLIVNDEVINTSNTITTSVNGVTALNFTVNPRNGRNLDAIGVNGVRLTATESNFQLNGVAQFPSVNNDTIFGSDVTDRVEGLAGNDLIAVRSGNDTVFGGAGNDTIFGNNASFAGQEETFVTSEGNVTLSGSTDILFGDEGNDIVAGDNVAGAIASPIGNSGDSSDFVDGGAGNDTLYGNDLSDTVYGGAGADLIFGEGGSDLLVGGTDNDTLSGDVGGQNFNGRAADVILGLDGNDSIIADSGDDYVEGGNGDDFIEGNSDDDLIAGGAGSDKLFGGPGTVNVLVGGGSRDTLEGQAGSIFNVLIGKIARNDIDPSIDLLAGIAGFSDGRSILGDFTGRDGAYLYNASSTLPTVNIANFFASIQPDGVGDLIITNGIASLVTGDGSTINGVGTSTSNPNGVVALSAAVYPAATYGGLTNLSPIAGDAATAAFPNGIEGDVLFVPASLGTATINLATGTATYTGTAGIDTLVAIESALGGPGSDFITGSAGGNLLAGGDGDDTLVGGGGADYLSGGVGSDSITGSGILNGAAGEDTLISTGAGDVLNGGSGDDLYVINNDTDVVQETDVTGGTFDVVRITGAGNYIGLDITNIERIEVTVPGVILSPAAALLLANNPFGISTTFFNAANFTGGPGPDLLFGSPFDDTLNGAGGPDNIVGNAGNDVLSGGDGADTINGGTGIDTLTGGSGNDTFFFAGVGVLSESSAAVGVDSILDWNAGDVIRVPAVIPPAGVQSLSLAGGGFSNFGDIITGIALQAGPVAPGVVIDVEVTFGAVAGRYVYQNTGAAAVGADDFLVAFGPGAGLPSINLGGTLVPGGSGGLPPVAFI
jgi:Ca2+-binding RTX toxin-like protein